MDWSKIIRYIVLLIVCSTPVLGKATLCCPENLSIVKGGCLEHGVASRNVTTPYNFGCKYGMFLLDPSITENDNFRVDYNDVLVVGDESSGFRIGPERYCIGELSRDNSVATTKVAMVCADGETLAQSNLFFIIRGVCAVISVVFLLITIVCYLILPELRDLQGKCMLCAVISLCVGFFALSIVQLRAFDHIDDSSCVILGVMIYIWLLSFFFWLNVVSFNLWRSVVARARRFEERQLFGFYSAYAWGCPLVLAGIMLALQYGPAGHKIVGHEKCFLGGWWSFTMFYAVIGIILIANSIMYGITCWKLWKGMQNIVDIKRRSMKYKCCMYLKLFLISGLTWIFEIISMVFETSEEYWLFTDVINGLQGVLMFLLLIAFRPRALRALAARGFCCLKMPQRWRHKRDTELLHDEELDDEEDMHDEATRTINEPARNGL